MGPGWFFIHNDVFYHYYGQNVHQDEDGQRVPAQPDERGCHGVDDAAIFWVFATQHIHKECDKGQRKSTHSRCNEDETDWPNFFIQGHHKGQGVDHSSHHQWSNYPELHYLIDIALIIHHHQAKSIPSKSVEKCTQICKKPFWIVGVDHVILSKDGSVSIWAEVAKRS